MDTGFQPSCLCQIRSIITSGESVQASTMLTVYPIASCVGVVVELLIMVKGKQL